VDITELEVLRMIRRDYPFIDLDKTRTLIRLTLNRDGNALAERPDTMAVRLNTCWCVYRNGHNITINEAEMYYPEKWALAVEWEAYSTRLNAALESKTELFELLVQAGYFDAEGKPRAGEAGKRIWDDVQRQIRDFEVKH
jgi:hypothetical protein